MAVASIHRNIVYRGAAGLEVSTRKDMLVTPNGNLNLVRAVYQKGGSKELFLYWFQMRDKTITDEYSLEVGRD